MYIGINSRYKDKRVDRVLRDLGYDNSAIFYSPMSVSVTYLLMFLAAGGYFIFTIFYQWLFIVSIAVGIFLCLFYLVSAYSNNSFAVTENELIVVNPNFPFRRHVVIPLKDIRNVLVGLHAPLYRKVLLLLVNNYVDISTENLKVRYYCIGLEADAYDENLTEKTIEDFAKELKGRNIEVVIDN